MNQAGETKPSEETSPDFEHAVSEIPIDEVLWQNLFLTVQWIKNIR